MLEARNLSVYVEGRPVVREVSITIPDRGILLLTGPNGSGKSTLARAIMGDPRLEVRGSIRLDGEEIGGLPPEERFRKGLFLTFQSPPEFEGVRILDFFERLGADVKRAREALERVGLDASFLLRFLHSGLSGGEKKRLELAQVLVVRPKYVIFDEIDSGVDIESVEKMVDIVKELARNMGILFITHNPLSLQLLEGVSRLRMEGGRIVEDRGSG